MSTTRETIITTTCGLIERQGYHATGLNEIVQASGAPKGSLYYYFPDGKEQIVEEALEWAGKMIEGRIREHLSEGNDLPEALQRFILLIADQVEQSEFRAGGPLQAVALETSASSERINQACRRAYDRLLAAFKDQLREAGLPEEGAVELAGFITSTIEGATLLSRAYHSGDPLRKIANILSGLVADRLEG